MHAFDLAADDVEVLRRIQGHVHPGQLAKLARPLARAVDQHFAAHVALRGAHTHGLAALHDDAGYLDTFNNFYAPVARALGQRHTQVGGVGFAVAGQPDGAMQIVGAHHGVAVTGFLGRDKVALHAKAVGHGSLFFEHLHAFRGAGHVHAAALLPAGGQAGFGFQRGVELNAVLAHHRHIAVGAHGPDEARSVPGGAAGELALLQ